MKFLSKFVNGRNQRNAIFGGVGAVANPLLQLVATPILFKSLGAEDFGVWALITSVLAASSVASLGLGEAGTKFVALYRTKNEPFKLVQVVQNVFCLYFGLGIIAACILWMLVPWLVQDVFRFPEHRVEVGIHWLRIATAGLVARFVYSVFEAVLRGYNRYDLEASWGMTTTMVTSLAAIVCVLTGGGLSSILVCSILVLCLASVGMAISSRMLIGNWRFVRPSIDRQALREIFGFGVFTWIQGINGIILNQLDRLVLGSLLGPAAVGYYAVCLQLVQTAHAIVVKASAFVFPEAVKHQSGHSYQLRSLASRGMELTTIAGWVLSGGLVFFGGEFLTVWLGASFAEAATAMLTVLAMWSALSSGSMVPYYILNGTGNERINTWCGLLSTAIFILVAFLLIPAWGALGAAVARLSTVVVTIVTRTILFRRVLGDNRWFTGVATLVPIGVPLLLVVPYLTQESDLLHASLVLKIVGYTLGSGLCAGLLFAVYKKIIPAAPPNHVSGIALP